jgi:hypothetical protein
VNGYGDHDAMRDADLEASPIGGELPIVSFNDDVDRRLLRRLKMSAPPFADDIDALVRANAPRCPIKSLCRHAGRVLAEHCGTPTV